ncbi:MAG: right-handed parallel beta-helix repeat-containing protein [Gammaproteobacteria bacterium]|nr:right-handed parallel beta-helix repeat-containing protein [Gammaproteobacteria bacterium]MDH5239236.1 right-handed parallel beta-helix repeat-containing protein [Gammaproteobacteria bacterium]MDH5259899.1 right-handed parallel beta-helix repeat-containing protein [Gammaproteobacteria bacterium]
MILAAALLVNATVRGDEIGPGDDLEAAIGRLSPGGELLLRGGIYQFDQNVTITAVGTSNSPITIRAKDGERVTFSQATTNHNVVEINASAYLIIRGIEFVGGSQGIRLINSDFVTIEQCEIHDVGDVAISANSGGTYEGLIIRQNHIHHTNDTGEGMYLGCNSDGCRVANSIIEDNYIHHTNQPSVTQGDGIELKEGSYGNVIRNNVIHDTNYPGILTYSTVGNGPPNIIEGNVVWNSGDNTVQMAADVVFRNNIVLGNVSLQAHQAGSPSNMQIVHNTIINSGTALQVRNVTGPVVIANNAIYSESRAIDLISGALGQVTLAGNVGSGGVAGASTGYKEGNGLSTDFTAAHYNGAPPIDLFPSTGSALIRAGASPYLTPLDFNGSQRGTNADSGAYRFDAAGNPGWIIRPGFKDRIQGGIAPQPPQALRAN